MCWPCDFSSTNWSYSAISNLPRQTKWWAGFAWKRQKLGLWTTSCGNCMFLLVKCTHWQYPVLFLPREQHHHHQPVYSHCRAKACPMDLQLSQLCLHITCPAQAHFSLISTDMSLTHVCLLTYSALFLSLKVTPVIFIPLLAESSRT